MEKEESVKKYYIKRGQDGLIETALKIEVINYENGISMAFIKYVDSSKYGEIDEEEVITDKKVVELYKGWTEKDFEEVEEDVNKAKTLINIEKAFMGGISKEVNEDKEWEKVSYKMGTSLRIVTRLMVSELETNPSKDTFIDKKEDYKKVIVNVALGAEKKIGCYISLVIVILGLIIGNQLLSEDMLKGKMYGDYIWNILELGAWGKTLWVNTLQVLTLTIVAFVFIRNINDYKKVRYILEYIMRIGGKKGDGNESNRGGTV